MDGSYMSRLELVAIPCSILLFFDTDIDMPIRFTMQIKSSKLRSRITGA